MTACPGVSESLGGRACESARRVVPGVRRVPGRADDPRPVLELGGHDPGLQVQQRQKLLGLPRDTAADDEAKIAQAIAGLLTLLGDDTVTGSIRAIMGPSSATAGTGSLRALRAQTNTNVVSAASIKALIGLTIDLAQRVIDDARATRRIARQTLRLARLSTGDYSTADVGTDA